MPKQLLLLIGGMVVASLVVAAGLIAFILPSDVLAPTTAQRAEEAAQAEADAQAEDDEDGPGGGTDSDAVGDAEPGGEDTGEIDQEQADEDDGTDTGS